MSTPDIEDLQKQIDLLEKQNEQLKKTAHVSPSLTFDINEYGAIIIRGLGKYQLKLFAEQIYRLYDHEKELRKFVEDNKSKLSWKHMK